jgi:hypothetical protein
MFDPHANMPRINRGMVYLGACLIAGIRLARERQVNIRVIPTRRAIEESLDLPPTCVQTARYGKDFGRREAQHRRWVRYCSGRMNSSQNSSAAPCAVNFCLSRLPPDCIPSPWK